MGKFIEEWTRLRNAVYVVYPYARIAGATINDINKNLVNVSAKKERKSYIKTREKELKREFSDPLSNLSVYQGKILMKLINRQTGNNLVLTIIQCSVYCLILIVLIQISLLDVYYE